MIAWLGQNWGTVLVLAVVAVVVAAIVVFRIRARRQGKSSCGCGCDYCAMRGSCHPEKQQETSDKKS